MELNDSLRVPDLWKTKSLSIYFIKLKIVFTFKTQEVMAMIIVFAIFGLFWLGITLASITYMVFKNSKSLTRKLEEHPPFWLQDYYAFLDRYHVPLLIGSVTLGIGLTVWGLNSQTQEPKMSCFTKCDNYTTRTYIKKRRSCQSKRNKITYIERSAMPYSGSEDLYHFIRKHQNNRTGETGTVYVEFYVQEDGSLEDVSVSSSVSPSLDKEAMRLIKAYPKGWKPALYHGRPIEQRMVIPIHFE